MCVWLLLCAAAAASTGEITLLVCFPPCHLVVLVFSIPPVDSIDMRLLFRACGALAAAASLVAASPLIDFPVHVRDPGASSTMIFNFEMYDGDVISTSVDKFIEEHSASVDREPGPILCCC